jgi:hypothetical protein
MTDKPYIVVPGTVEKLIAPTFSSEPEKVQIQVEVADHLFRDLRIESKLTDATGERIHLEPGARVQITVEATPEAVAGSLEKPI